MKNFQFYVTDDRYSVPTLTFAAASDGKAARGEARRLLAESPHHRAVEVRAGDTLLFTVRPATAAPPLRP